MRIPMTNTVDATTPDNRPRILFAGDSWQGEDHPYIVLDDTALRLIGNLDTGISLDGEFGTQIKGPVSLSAQPSDIRVASYWALNPMLLLSIGSSAAFPIPTLVPTTPAIVQAKSGFASAMGV